MDEDILLPPWAIRRAGLHYELGNQLCTRDGRKIGNAYIVVVHPGCLGTKKMYYQVLTDAGTKVVFSSEELKELFYLPEYVADIGEVLRKFDPNHGQMQIL